MMDTIEYFSDFLKRIAAPNFLAIGIVIILLWFLISGFVKGLKRRGRNQGPEDNNGHEDEE
jgi:hypothetical protein